MIEGRRGRSGKPSRRKRGVGGVRKKKRTRKEKRNSEFRVSIWWRVCSTVRVHRRL